MALPPEPPPQLFGTNPPGPPPPLLPGGAPMPMPGMSFNPGQFFNMFEGVNMPMGPPPGQQLQQQQGKGQGQQQQAKGKSGVSVPAPGPPPSLHMPATFNPMDFPLPQHSQMQMQQMPKQAMQPQQGNRGKPQHGKGANRTKGQPQMQGPPMPLQFGDPPPGNPGQPQAGAVFSADQFFSMAAGMSMQPPPGAQAGSVNQLAKPRPKAK